MVEAEGSQKEGKILDLLQRSFRELSSQLRHEIVEELKSSLGNLRLERDLLAPVPAPAWETMGSTSGASSQKNSGLTPSPSIHAVEPHMWMNRHFKTIAHRRYLEEMGVELPEEKPMQDAKVSPEPAEPEIAPVLDIVPQGEAHDSEASSIQVTSTQRKVKVRSRSSMSERVLGLTPQAEERKPVLSSMTRSRAFAAKITSSMYFEVTSLAVILANTLQIGLQTNHMAEQMLTATPIGFRIADIFFWAFFTLEVCLRLYVHRCRYFTMWGFGWNILDLFLVGAQTIEEVFILAASASGEQVDTGNSSLMRAVRILRGIKVLRLMRVIRFAQDLQLIVNCLILSIRTFLWSAALLLISIYVIAIYITQTALAYRLENQGTEGSEKLKEWWGSVTISVLSLFQGVTGGVDWNDIAQPLIGKISPWFGACFVLYMAFTILALMNVITGTFVETVSQQANDLRLRNSVLQARKLFTAIDADHSGFLTAEEILEHTKDPAVIEFFETVDVDPSEAASLLEVIDMDGNGRVNFEEFLQGIIRLNGQPKSSDLLLVAREMKRYYQHEISELQVIRQSLQLMSKECFRQS